jgi:hypothetical protein
MANKNVPRNKQPKLLDNLGIFYLMIAALFAIPLLGAVVVVGIKGILDLRHVIIYGSLAILFVGTIFLIRFFYLFARKIKQGGAAANSELAKSMARGEQVQISILRGLLTFTYAGRGNGAIKALPNGDENDGAIPLIPETTESTGKSQGLAGQLKTLHDLKNQYIINEEEFFILKDKLINGPYDSNNSPDSGEMHARRSG